MALPAWLTTTTCDIHRPFGSASPTSTAVPCRVVGELSPGQSMPRGDGIRWTHRMDVDPATDIRDELERNIGANVLVWADGDEVRIPSGGSTRYAVAWVEEIDLGTPEAHLRVYLIRHSR